ncbi:MAG: type II secretion system F family protein [Wenzhouxiangellaceae bacterium]|nr:type II secretion system F family protein [Wenzhouxiangellaceae bacterium]
MSTWDWRGRNSRGESVGGQLQGDNRDAVANQLINTGITPIEIERARVERAGRSLRRLLTRESVSTADLIFFTRQMYALTRAGVPMTRGLQGVAQAARNPLLKRTVMALIEEVEAGRDLAQAMARHPRVFSPMFVNMIRVGAAAGSLEMAFELMGRYLERDREIRDRIQAALRYPTMVIVAMVIAVAILMVFVIPVFATFFDRFDAELPWATKVLITTSTLAREWWLLVALALVGAVLAFRFWTQSASGRYQWDRLKFRLPGVGSILFRATLARFSRAFSMTWRAGVPLVQALTLVARAVENEYVAQAVVDMRTGAERGESLLRTAEATGLFSPLVLQMLGVGEETGEVDKMLDETADFYEREVDYDLDNLSAYIEPILLVFMAVLVLILALGVFLPMWDVGRAALG